MAEHELTASDWRGYAQGQFPDSSWSVDGNVLRAIATGPRVDLITRRPLRDFALSFDWRLPRGGSTAVVYRVNEDAGPAMQTGPAMQLLDDEHHPDGADALTSCGALYGLMAPWHDERSRSNTYHGARIVVSGTRIEYWIDDTQVLGCDLGSDELRERIARSRFRDFPQFAQLAEGHIVLQHRGTVTQHELAVALGYSDPAVSTMLVELAKDGYIQTTKSPEHARKRLVTITAKGNEVVAQGRHLLDSHFDQLMVIADIDAQHYRELTERLHQALIAKMKKEKV